MSGKGARTQVVESPSLERTGHGSEHPDRVGLALSGRLDKNTSTGPT